MFFQGFNGLERCIATEDLLVDLAAQPQLLFLHTLASP